MERFQAGQVRTGSAYDADRLSARARLAATAKQRRLTLGADLTLVFDTSDEVRLALEETLRAERLDDAARVAAETAAFASLLGDDHELAATLYVDTADPVALADRLTELTGVERVVTLEVGGRRVTARCDAADGGSGAFHLFFALDGEARAAIVAGAPTTICVDHPACHAVATLTSEQARSISTDLQR